MLKMIGKTICKLALATVLGLALMAQALANQGVTVFAAASLTNALEEVAAQYKKEKQVDVVLSLASSSTLARQIEAGAPADLFISADQKWMDYVQKLNVIEAASRKVLLNNSMVLIAPKSSPLSEVTIDKNTDWQQLLNGERLAVGDPDHVPIGVYAKQALQALGAWQTLQDKLAPAADVRSGLALVERGEVPLGIVYSSDALVSPSVKVIGHFPQDTYPKVEYPLAIVSGHDNPLVRGFYDYLQTPQAAAVFSRYGFVIAQ